MEASALHTTHAAGLRGGPTPLLRLASDERLVVLTRRGNQAAFEALVARYQSRLLAFCRHMLSSREDAEDVLQEVFAASYNAMVADERPINVRPWLYRIARNRSLNHLRRTQAVGVDSMDVHVAEHGTTTADKVHGREELRLLMGDVKTLPETQRTALLLREIDALSYEQIAQAMDTTIPSVKSLLVRARVSLAEAAEARALSCDEVREELGEVAEGIRQRVGAPVRRHLRQCERCSGFRKQLRETNKALAAVLPVGPLLFLKKALLAQLGTTASAGGASAATSVVAGGVTSGGASALSAGVTAVATKTAAGLAAAAIVTAGVAEVNHASGRHPLRTPAPALRAAAPQVAPAPVVVASHPQPVTAARGTAVSATEDAKAKAKAKADKLAADAAASVTTTPAAATTAAPIATTPEATAAPQQESDTTTLPQPPTSTTPAPAPGSGVAPGPAPAPAPAPAPRSGPPPGPAPAQPAPGQPADGGQSAPAAEQPPGEQPTP